MKLDVAGPTADVPQHQALAEHAVLDVLPVIGGQVEA